MECIALPGFPGGTVSVAEAALVRAGIGLRPASERDLPWLARLYTDWRLPELLSMPWPATQKRAFGESQFALQHRHFVAHFPSADFWLVEKAGAPAGRLYLDRTGTDWRLIDILLAADARSRGIGRLLLDWIQREAEAAGSTITLHVAANNPRAHALYRRIGFAEVDGGDAMHQRMRWAPGG